MMRRALAGRLGRWWPRLVAGILVGAGASVLVSYLQGRVYLTAPGVSVVMDHRPLRGSHAWRNRLGDLMVQFPEGLSPTCVMVYRDGTVGYYPSYGSLSLGPVEVLYPDFDDQDANTPPIMDCECRDLGETNWVPHHGHVPVCDDEGKPHAITVRG